MPGVENALHNFHGNPHLFKESCCFLSRLIATSVVIDIANTCLGCTVRSTWYGNDFIGDKDDAPTDVQDNNIVPICNTLVVYEIEC